MNFVDAAVALLRESQGPMHVEELCRLALERGLLDSPGQSPLRSLKGRLTTELKRGPDSRVIRVEDDLWALADAGRNGEEAHAATVEPETVVEANVDADVDVDDDEDELDAAEEEEDDAEDDEDDDDDLDDDEDDEDDEDLDDEDDEDEDEDEDEEQAFDEADADPATDEGRYQAPEPAPEHLDADDAGDDFEEADADEADADADTDDHDLDDEDTTDLGDDPIRRAEAAQRALEEQESLTSEEKELIQAYGGEPDTAQVGSLVEYRDQQTADEDRPMVPELLPERRGGRQREDWKARRERMREKRRERREGRERNKAAREQSKAETPAPAEGEARAERATERATERTERATERAAESAEAETPRPAAPPAAEGDLARRACEVLASIKGAQPVPVRQLAQMMKKRRLIEAEPDAVWRALKAALLADNQRRASAGLPPRVAYRGRDLFSYRPSANPELESCETALETAAHRLRGATERVLAARLVDLPLPVLEQVIQLFLVQTGWREVEWIKRVDRSGYALAREPGDGAQVMIAARAGNQQVDRRGVGELRAGVAAKNLSRGFLLAPRELGGEARSELERPGKPVSALCGLPLASALVGAGIGVAQRMMTVSYLDVELFDRLADGPETR